MNVKKMVTVSILACIALCIYAVESSIPPLCTIPGVRLGLSNAVILAAIYITDLNGAFFVFVLKIILSSLLFGQPISLLFSIAGGLLCYVVMAFLSKHLEENQIWAISVFGAFFHNVGQIIVAVVLTSQLAVMYYFLALVIASIVSGVFTGLCAQYSVKLLRKNKLI